MVAYSQCEYSNLSLESIKSMNAARGDRIPLTGDDARLWRNRGKCPLTPNKTTFILESLSIPTNANIYLAVGDGLMELEGLTSVYKNVFTKFNILSGDDFEKMHGNTEVVLDYFVSINSDAYVVTYFGNVNKMVAAIRAYKGLYRTIFLSRRGFSVLSEQGLKQSQLIEALWKVHIDDYVMGVGFVFPDCFCEFKL